MVMNQFVAIPSPFPWAPGHVVTEAEYVLQQQVLGGCKKRIYLVFLPGPVSSAFVELYSDWFEQFKITLVCDPKLIQSILTSIPTERYLNAAISHCFHVLDERYGSLGWRSDDAGVSHYSHLSCGRISQKTSSTLYCHNIQNDFSYNYYSLPPAFKPLPPRNLGLIESLIPGLSGRKLAILNIREHRANGSAGLTYQCFIPLIKYLLARDYFIVDASHESKSCSSELDELGVFCYWRLPNKNFYLDIDLFSHASFYVGGGGISHLAYALKIPSIWVGGLFPIGIPAHHGYVLPCRLYDRSTGLALDKDMSFFEYLSLRSPWEDGYDCWAKTWGKGNPFNCYELLKSKYIIERPSPVALLNTFIALESSKSQSDAYIETYPFDDVQSRPFIGSRVSPYF